MPAYKVISEFIDRETGKRIKPGETIHVDEHRAEGLLRARVIAPGPIDDGVPEENIAASGDTEAAFLDPADLQDMNVADLRKLASDMGIDVPSRATKAKLIELITAIELDDEQEVNTDAPPASDTADGGASDAGGGEAPPAG